MPKKEDIQREAYNYFNNMNDDEFVELLESFGVEIEEGQGTEEGKIVYADEMETTWQTKSKVAFSLNQSSNFKNPGINKTSISTKFPLAC